MVSELQQGNLERIWKKKGLATIIVVTLIIIISALRIITHLPFSYASGLDYGSFRVWLSAGLEGCCEFFLKLSFPNLMVVNGLSREVFGNS